MGNAARLMARGKPYNCRLCAARHFAGGKSQDRTSSPMPIYAYKCESCGFAKGVLQKMSEAPLTDCPQCGPPSFKKQVTAAGFQLKGSGWYVTDFRGGDSKPQASKPADAKASEAGGSDGKTSDSGSAPAPASAAAAAAPASTPAAPASKGASGDSSTKV
jgi:putative FmdB family regulatory protein